MRENSSNSGNIRTHNEVLPKAVNHTYTYDGMGRLTNETVSGDYTRNDTYTYDKRGNRIGITALDGTTTFTYNKNNQVLTLESVKPDYTDSLTYIYDDYGNRIKRSGMLYGHGEWYDYGYDAFNRLDYMYVSFGNTQTYTYDGDNMRQSIADNYNGTTEEIYDGGNLIGRKNGTNTHLYIYGLEQEFYISGTNSGIYSTNHRGDISKEISIDGTKNKLAISRKNLKNIKNIIIDFSKKPEDDIPIVLPADTEQVFSIIHDKQYYTVFDENESTNPPLFYLAEMLINEVKG